MQNAWFKLNHYAVISKSNGIRENINTNWIKLKIDLQSVSRLISKIKDIKY